MVSNRCELATTTAAPPMNDAIVTSTAARERLALVGDRAGRVWRAAVGELEPSEWRIPEPPELARIAGMGEADVQAGLDELVEVGLVRHTHTETDRIACYEIDETMAYNTAAPPQPQPFVRWCRHQGHDPATEEARAAYRWYHDGLGQLHAAVRRGQHRQ